MRPALIAAVMVGSVSYAYIADVTPEFIGAMLGAFIATWIRNDKRRMQLIAKDVAREVTNEHLRAYYHRKSESGES